MDIVSLLWPDGVALIVAVFAILFAVVRVARRGKKRIQKSQEIAPAPASPALQDRSESYTKNDVVVSAPLSQFVNFSASEIASLRVSGVHFDEKGFLKISLSPGKILPVAPPSPAIPASNFTCTFQGCGKSFATLEEGAKHEEENLYHVVQPIPAV